VSQRLRIVTKVRILRDQAWSSASHSILVIEDEPLIAMVVSMFLEEAGFRVCGVARTAAQALELAARMQPAAAVVDIRLGPGPDGIEVAEQLSALHRCGIVFVSGSGERETIDRALSVEGAVFLQKPVDPEALVSRLRTLLSR
jgi:two-component system, response regulator PdtaR